MGPIFNEKVVVCPPKTHAATEKEKKKKEKTQETQRVSKWILGVCLDTTYFC